MISPERPAGLPGRFPESKEFGFRESSHIHEVPVHPIRAQMWETLTSCEVEKEYVPDRERQQIVFDRINWETFLDELGIDVQRGEAFRFAVPSWPRHNHIDGQTFGLDLDGTRTRKADQSAGRGKQLRGKLFEMLIQADPAFGERTALEKELLSLAHSPEAFGLEKELGYHRNPDMAFLIVQKEDGVEIIGVGESKLGLLNERSFKQLSETGFARGVKALVEVVNTLPDPAAHGLVEVARARLALRSLGEGGTEPIKPLLTISPDFTQLLVVPANRKIEWASTLVNRREFSAEGREKFYELLNDTRHVRTARAAFSTAEVSAMAKAINT